MFTYLLVIGKTFNITESVSGSQRLEVNVWKSVLNEWVSRSGCQEVGVTVSVRKSVLIVCQEVSVRKSVSESRC